MTFGDVVSEDLLDQNQNDTSMILRRYGDKSATTITDGVTTIKDPHTGEDVYALSGMMPLGGEASVTLKAANDLVSLAIREESEGTEDSDAEEDDTPEGLTAVGADMS